MKTKNLLLVALLVTGPVFAAPPPKSPPAHIVTIDYAPGYCRLAFKYWLWIPYSIYL